MSKILIDSEWAIETKHNHRDWDDEPLFYHIQCEMKNGYYVKNLVNYNGIPWNWPCPVCLKVVPSQDIIDKVKFLYKDMIE